MLALGATCAAWARLRRLQRALRFDPSEVARALQRDASRRRLESLSRRAREAQGLCWEVAFWEDLLRATTQEQQTAAANEHLSDSAMEFDWGAAIPGAAARIGLLGPMGVAFWLAATGHASMAEVGPVFCWCVAGLLGPIWVGRTANGLARDLRAGVDQLVARTMAAARADAQEDGARGSARARLDLDEFG